MPDYLGIIATALSLAATVISVLVGYGTLQQRKKEPGEKRWTEWGNWRKDVDERLLSVAAKLDNDNRRLKKMDEESTENREFQRLMLKSMKGIITASSSSPGNEEMRHISAEIDEFLIKR